jgi:hypothetical protein
MAALVALYSPPNRSEDSSAPRRRPDGEVSPTTVWSRRWPALGRVVSCGAVPAADRPTRRLPGGASGRCPGRRASLWSGRPRCPPSRPPPVLVHHWVSTRSGSSSGPLSSRPLSSHPVSDRRVSGRLGPSSGTGLSGRLVPLFQRSAVWCPPVRPVASVPSRVSPPWLLGPRRSGRAFTAGVGRVPCGLARARAARRRLRRPGRRRHCGGRGSTGRGGCRSRPGPACARAEAAAALGR